MVYHPDGTGRDMYVVGPRNGGGPNIVDVSKRITAQMNKEKENAILNASQMRIDNKVPANIPPFEMRALISRKIAEGNQKTIEDASLSAAKLTLSVSSSSEAAGLTGSIHPTRYNSGLSSGGNSPTSLIVLSRSHAACANGFFTTSQRGPSSYVSPKTPSSPHNSTGRVGQCAGAYDNALATARAVASMNGSLNGNNKINGTASQPSSPSTPLSLRAPSAGFSYTRHIYESTQEKALRTGLSFQPYEAPSTRTIFPEVRARYSNM